MPMTPLERFTQFMNELMGVDLGVPSAEYPEDAVTDRENQAFSLIEDWLRDGNDIKAYGMGREERFLQFMDHD